MSWRTGVLFAAGLLVGAVVGGWAVIQARNDAVWQDRATTSAMGNAPAPAASAAEPVQAQPVQGTLATLAVPTAAAQQCQADPVVARGAEDGKETLRSAPRTAGKSEVAALLLTGKEAAASGRMRDAEIAFLNGCRNAQAVSGPDAPVAMADAMYQLGRHYANVAQSRGAARSELLRRSDVLLQAAAQTYQARYGASHEKTRFAQQALTTAQRLASGATLVPPLADAKPAAPAPAPTQAVAKAAKPAPAAAPVPAAAAKPAPEPPVAKAEPRPTPKPQPAHRATPREEPKEEAVAPPPPPTTARTEDRTERRRERGAGRESRATEPVREPTERAAVAEPAPERPRRARAPDPEPTAPARVAEPTPRPRISEPETATRASGAAREEPAPEPRVQRRPEPPVAEPAPAESAAPGTAEGSVGDVP